MCSLKPGKQNQACFVVLRALTSPKYEISCYLCRLPASTDSWCALNIIGQGTKIVLMNITHNYAVCLLPTKVFKTITSGDTCVTVMLTLQAGLLLEPPITRVFQKVTIWKTMYYLPALAHLEQNYYTAPIYYNIIEPSLIQCKAPSLFPWARNFTLIAQYWLVPGTDSEVCL
jgi:hypothetical protein